jgi:hypothetical protein
MPGTGSKTFCQAKLGIVQAEPEPGANRTIDNAIEKFLLEVKATTSPATLEAYKRDLPWFREHDGICFFRAIR